MNVRRVLAALLLAVVITGCGAGTPNVGSTPEASPTPSLIRTIEPPYAVKDFSLSDTTGNPRTLADLKGKYALLLFGYTHCPDFCPVSLAKLKQVKMALGDAAAQVTFVFVSVDGKRDTPAALGAYLKNFDAGFLGLTGDEGSVRALAGNFGVTFVYNKKSVDDMEYTVDHTVSSFLVNPQGQLERIYSYELDAASLAADVKARLVIKP